MSAHAQILALIDRYFDGVYTGNTALLATLFDDGAQVYGDIGGQAYHQPVAAYLRAVAGRDSPARRGEPFLMRPLNIDVAGSIASVKLSSPMLGFRYQLYLTLILRAGNWLIVNKTFIHIPALPTEETPCPT
ncbi:nuclear transport factor 2 family protein [Janthinobacterium sp. J1-1]|uniref:nuclear transport factor 2 family protein n=1 Tax=unclassified Janthinobacterium TaxID=2610881 RepID=UPI00281168BA|nr:nuclear transport factor 2 family protein [Janthinobacterium sp. J1-1]